METREDKKFDELMKQMLVDSKLESPSARFTSEVMREIESLELANKKSIPLIGRKVWITLAFLYTSLMVILVDSIELKNSNWFNSIHWSRFTGIFRLEGSNSMHISNTVTYGIAVVSILFLIQIFYLKRISDKSIQTY